MMGAAGNRVRLPRLARRRSPHGLELLAVAPARRPVTALTLLLPAGSAVDPPDRPGLASLTAALIGEGTRRTGAEAFGEAIDALGASFSASAGWDGFWVEIAGLAEDLPELAALFAEAIVEPGFDPVEVERMRGRRLQSLRRALDDSATVAEWVFLSRLYGPHPYGHPVSGNPSSVGGLGPADVAAFHARHAMPARACLAIASGLEPEAALDAVAPLWESWQAGAAADAPPSLPAVPDAPARLVLVEQPDRSQAQIRWGHVGLARRDPDFDAARLFNDILGGGGFASRLMQRVRAELGLTYGIGSGFDGRVGAGPFLISTTTPTSAVPRVLEEIDAVVGAMRREGPTAAELEAARARLVGGYALRFETPSQVARRLLELRLVGLPDATLESWQDEVLALDRDRVAAAAARLLRPESALVVIVGEVGELARSLAGMAPIETVEARHELRAQDA